MSPKKEWMDGSPVPGTILRVPGRVGDHPAFLVYVVIDRWSQGIRSLKRSHGQPESTGNVERHGSGREVAGIVCGDYENRADALVNKKSL